MSAETIQRVRFRERQRLRIADLATEQVYHLNMRRRHHVGHHRWGIVTGLVINKATNLYISPGFAIDGFGRDLVLSERCVIKPGDVNCLFEDKAAGTYWIDVWLLYARQAVNQPQNGQAVSQHNRWQEGVEIRLELADKAVPDDPRQPPGVAPEDLDFDPSQTLVDDPDKIWPVYLGYVICEYEYESINFKEMPPTNNRPYAQLVGELVQISPWARTHAGWRQSGRG